MSSWNSKVLLVHSRMEITPRVFHYKTNDFVQQQWSNIMVKNYMSGRVHLALQNVEHLMDIRIAFVVQAKLPFSIISGNGKRTAATPPEVSKSTQSILPHRTSNI